MKNSNLYNIILLLVLVLGSTGNKALAYPRPAAILDSRDYDYLQAEQNQKATILPQIISLDNSTSETKENSYNFLAELPCSCCSKRELLILVGQDSYFNSSDKRKTILHDLYPFHSFW